MSKPSWVLNQNEGVDTIHRNPLEICNTDDATGRQTVDARTAAQMLKSGQAKACQHCLGQSSQPVQPGVEG